VPNQELKQVVDEKFVEHFYYFKSNFDIMENTVSNLAADIQKRTEEVKNNANKPLDDKKYSQDLQNLIKDDTDDRNAKLLEEVNDVLFHLSQKKQNITYLWVGISIIFILQIIIFLK
jgi:hypothetical protein